LNQINIYSPLLNNKIKYVFDFIFEPAEDYILIYHDDLKIFSGLSGLKINYSKDIIPGSITISPSGYFENEILIPNFTKEIEYVDNDFSFDLVAAIFYLLSRAEEYNPVQLDEHGRYTHTESILYKRDLLALPVVDIWCNTFYELVQQYTGVKILTKYTLHSTIDVDHIYAFKSKSKHISAASQLKDIVTLNTKRLQDRKLDRDPFDTYDYLTELHRRKQIPLMFFFLTSERGEYDRSLSPDHSDFIQLVQELSADHPIGLHPSYHSYLDYSKILSEKTKLTSIIEKQIESSRQHYLRLSIPDTYKHLIKCGITKDYSMGYSNQLGFRAGTSRSFYWYDIQSDQQTDLQVFPFQIMDVTLRRLSNNDRNIALQMSEKVIVNIKAVNGTTRIIWHNSSFYDTEGWGDWDKTYEAILEYAMP